MNFFDQGLPLGRWFGIRVVLHWTFLVYAAYQLFYGRGPHSNPLPLDALQLGLLFAVVLMHEFGHALSCKLVGGQAERIILWPLGGIAFVQPPPQPTAWLITTVCGPLVNAVLWPIFYHVSHNLGITDSWSISVWYTTHTGLPLYVGLGCYFMWQINMLLLIFNLIPAYPMDGGRILQEILWYIVGYAHSRFVAGIVGIACGAVFIIVGFGLFSFTLPVVNYTLGGKEGSNTMLMVIGFLAASQSFAIVQDALVRIRAGHH